MKHVMTLVDYTAASIALVLFVIYLFGYFWIEQANR